MRIFANLYRKALLLDLAREVVLNDQASITFGEASLLDVVDSQRT